MEPTSRKPTPYRVAILGLDCGGGQRGELESRLDEVGMVAIPAGSRVDPQRPLQVRAPQADG